MDEAESALDIETQISFGFSSKIHWEGLLKEPRVVILAVAGAGKTYEIREITKSLRDEGKQAFFLRLEDLRDEFKLAFEGGAMGEFGEFTSWKETTEKAWFFLDAVDEAKLRDPGDFEKALLKFKFHLGDRIHQTNIVITSRITWEPYTEFSLVKRLLPYPKKQRAELSETGENPDLNLSQSDSANVKVPEKTPDKEQDPKVYSLSPLGNEQIKLFAKAKDIGDTNSFLEAIHRADASLFAARPQDLADLISYWTTHGKIGSRLELVQDSVKQKLLETDTKRAKLKPLTYKKALAGAELVAAATTLTSNSKVAVPEKKRVPGALPITRILKDWELNECNSLLELPIFDEAVYGTIRFHHRSVREYLASQWFLQLLRQGSRRRIEKLFFRVQYTKELITPSLRAILPWIAISDDQFRQKALRIAPEVLLEGGDSSQFPASVRSDILKSLCKEMAVSQSRHYSFDIAAVVRFAGVDIEDVICSLLVRYHEKSEIRTLLLRMVWQGKLNSCVGFAMSLVKDKTLEEYSRISAIRAIGGAGTPPERLAVVDYFVANCEDNNFLILNAVAESFGFKELSASKLLLILDRLPHPGEFNLEHLDLTLEYLINSASLVNLETFVKELPNLLMKKPHIEGKYCDVSQQHSWLVPIAARCCARLIRHRSEVMLSSTSINLMQLCSTYYRRYRNENDSSLSLSELVPQWSALNEKFCWYAVSQARKECNKDVPEIFQYPYHGTYWSPDVIGFDTALAWINSQSEMRDKLVALSLAFRAYVRDGRKREKRETFKKVVSGIPELENSLQSYLTPPRQSEEIKKFKRRERSYLQQIKKRKEKEEKCKQDWKLWLSGHIDNITDTQLVKEGKNYNSQRYLYERLRKFSSYGQKWACNNWKDLIADQNADVAEAFRAFLIDSWRQYRPAIRSEGIENPNSIPYGVIFGLSGLSIEANEHSDWRSSLTVEEAEHAVRFALWEMNGLPDWLQQLQAGFPEIVKDHFLREIEWELVEYDGDKPAHYVIDSLIWHGEDLRSQLSNSVLDILKGHEPTHAETLKKALSIIFSSETVSDTDLVELVQKKIGLPCSLDNFAIWYAVWVSVNPHEAIPQLEAYLTEIFDSEKATEFAMKFVVNLMGGSRFHYQNSHEKHKCVEHLESLYLLIHQYIRVSEDLNRSGGGAYSPGLRDGAQDARSAILTQLQQIPGKLTYLALKKIASEHPDEKSRALMQVLVKDRAEQDADIGKWSLEDVIDFARDQEQTPNNAKQLFELSVERLLDLKHDLENGENSVAYTWQRETKETKLRILIAKWMEEHAAGKYTVHQEEEQADAKKPDIRIHGVGGLCTPVPIELKIAAKWSGSKLFERLENQLCNDYLRDYWTRFGIFLLVFRGGDKKWEHPITNQLIQFSALVEALQQHAKDYIQNRAEIDDITVIGIDLTVRQNPVRFDAK
jgi:hypothetical protein